MTGPPTCRSLAIVLATAAIGLGSAGCIEQSDDLLGTDPLPGLVPDPPSLVDASPSTTPAGDDPWARTHWEATRIEIPMGSTIHEPTYVDRPIAAGSDRTAGRDVSPVAFPTPGSALVVETDGGTVALSAGVAPFAAVLDLVGAPVRMILTPPWTPQVAPTPAWELLPSARIPSEDAS